MFKKLKKIEIKGALYRKLKKEKEQPEPQTRAGAVLRNLKKSYGEFPKFTITPVNKLIMLPSSTEAKIKSIIYPLIKPYAYANIRYDETENVLVYNVIEPRLNEIEEKIFKKIKEGLVQIIDISLGDINNAEKIFEFLESHVRRLINEYGFELNEKEYVKIMYYIHRDFVGLNRIEPLMNDPYVEDVGCDGVGIHVYVVHQRFGSLKTNIVYKDENELREFVIKLAERADRYISYAEPLLDGTLKDGSRVQASLAGDVTTKGPTFSIRKFRETPFTPVDIMRLNTASAEMLAYLWFVVENGANILITGGVSTGKTSLLNTISLFIPEEAKIVSIEDSVTGDTEIIVKENNEIKTVKIGELIDRLLEEEGCTERITNKKDIEVLTMDADYKMTFKRAGSFIRHKTRKDVYEISTATGRKVKVTKDHSLFGLDENGEILPATPEELRNLRFLAVPRTIPWEGKELKAINLLEHLDAFKDDFVGGVTQEFFEKSDFNEFKKAGVSRQKYRYWKKHHIVEASVFKKILRNDMDIEPGKLHIIGKTSSTTLPVLFEISDEFLEFLGLWVGDGSYDNNRVVISNVDKECIDCVKNVAEKIGVRISIMSDKVSMSVNSTLLYKLMLTLGFRGHADTKRIPTFINNLSNRQVASFLRGYFSADGTVKNFEVGCSSQSLDLLNDIQTLLLRFGIISRISHAPRKDKCKELSISSSENIAKFKDIGFLQERKNAKIDIVGARKAHHTKMDIIPLGEGLLQEISRFEELSWPYRNGLQNIGRQFLLEIAEKHSEEADSEIIDRLAHADIFWDRIKEIIKLPTQEMYVYDISVPETENFVGANILLHNTRELNLPHDNWIPSITRIGFTGSGVGEITMFELLRESFRQNPDYLIVGEVRGKEAYVMFQGMASILGNEKVAVLNDEHLKFVPIAKLADREYKTFAVDPETGKINIAKVTKRVAHRPQKELLKIKTSSGREITVTPYHSLFTFRNGLQAVEAGKLTNGSKIAIPGRLPSGFADIDYIDLTELKDVRIFSPEYFKKAVEKLGFDKASKICNIKSISDYYANFKLANPASMKAEKFFALMKAAKIEADKSMLQVKFLRKSRPRSAILKLTPELLRLVGYYISEGSINKSGKSSRVVLYNKNKEILDDMRHCISSLGLMHRERMITRGFGTATELAFSDKVLSEFLLQKCGHKYSKQIPDFVFGLSKEKIGHFMSALFAGDGYYSRHCFGYSTSLRQLADQLAHLLLMLGIVAHIRERKGRTRAEKEYEIKFYRREEREEFLRYVKPIGKKAEIKDTKKVGKKDRFGDIFLDSVKSIEKISLGKEVPVYDLVVPGVQNFLGGFGGVTLHNSGHPSISTMHAGSVDDVIKRLQTKPINLSAGLLDSLDVVLVMVHAREKGKSARRIKEVVEIENVDPTTGNPHINKPFVWIAAQDTFEYKGNSWILSKISAEKGIPLNKIVSDIAKRKKLLNWLYQNNVTQIDDVVKHINMYRRDKEAIDRLLKIKKEEDV